MAIRLVNARSSGSSAEDDRRGRDEADHGSDVRHWKQNGCHRQPGPRSKTPENGHEDVLSHAGMFVENMPYGCRSMVLSNGVGSAAV